MITREQLGELCAELDEIRAREGIAHEAKRAAAKAVSAARSALLDVDMQHRVILDEYRAKGRAISLLLFKGERAAPTLDRAAPSLFPDPEHEGDPAF